MKVLPQSTKFMTKLEQAIRFSERLNLGQNGVFFRKFPKSQNFTEKSILSQKKYNQYHFFVSPSARKPELKKFFEILFNLKVKKIRTANQTCKKKKLKNFTKRQTSSKKAYVTFSQIVPKNQIL